MTEEMPRRRKKRELMRLKILLQRSRKLLPPSRSIRHTSSCHARGDSLRYSLSCGGSRRQIGISSSHLSFFFLLYIQSHLSFVLILSMHYFLMIVLSEKCKVVIFLSSIASVEFHYTLFGRARWKSTEQAKGTGTAAEETEGTSVADAKKRYRYKQHHVIISLYRRGTATRGSIPISKTIQNAWRSVVSTAYTDPYKQFP